MPEESKAVFVSDVDGVIVDSTEECLVIAWNAYQLYSNKGHFIRSPADAERDYSLHFRSLRNYVRSMDEYLIVFQSERGEISSQEMFENKMETLNNDERTRFGKCFFEARRTFKNGNKKAWIELHHFYPGIRDFILNVRSHCKLYIVTGKDRESVLDFFEYMDLPLQADSIYDKEIAKNKLSALKMISTREDLPYSRITFLDDNITHLIGPLQCGFAVLLASWGYVMPEHLAKAKEIGIPVVNLEHLNEGWKVK